MIMKVMMKVTVKMMMNMMVMTCIKEVSFGSL